MCGLANLDWEARQERAIQILASPEWKQQLCNDLIGLSFRELEVTLQGVASERQSKEDNYERKLKAYSNKTNRESKHSGQKSLHGRDHTGDSGTSLSSKQLPSRTLQQILAQVYASKRTEEFSNEPGADPILAFYRKAATRERQEVSGNVDDGDD